MLSKAREKIVSNDANMPNEMIREMGSLDLASKKFTGNL